MSNQLLPIRERLMAVGLRPTRQRLLIWEWLFQGEDKHFTAEDLHKDILAQDGAVSLATIYNTLGAFTDAGLLNTVNIGSGRVFYDTNTEPHHHIYQEDDYKLMDIDVLAIETDALPGLPAGQKIERIDIIIRTRNEK